MVEHLTIGPDEREEQKHAATKKRMFAIGAVLIICVTARILVKNPPQPKTPDHKGQPFRALPGMLNNMPESERQKLSPQMLAQLKEADQRGTSRTVKEAVALVKKKEIYVPYEAPTELAAKHEEPKFNYTTARKPIPTEMAVKSEPVDVTKNTLVVFENGGYFLAESAYRERNKIEIKIHRFATAQIPARLVKKVTGIGKGWIPAVPKGYVRLKPAKGITVVLGKETAKRITIRKA